MLPRRLLLLVLVRLGMRQHLTDFFASGKYAADRLERNEVKKEKVLGAAGAVWSHQPES